MRDNDGFETTHILSGTPNGPVYAYLIFVESEFMYVGDKWIIFILMWNFLSCLNTRTQQQQKILIQYMLRFYSLASHERGKAERLNQ